MWAIQVISHMAVILYNFAINCFRLLLWSISPFHSKARDMVRGRKDWDVKLSADFQGMKQPVVWFHCASLGEFEQGRPLIESFHNEFPGHKILLTFYSPSGYQVRKDYPFAFAVHYLPWDTANNARRFYQIVNPEVAIFIKYEFWFHLIYEGKKRNKPVIVCSSLFNRNQIFFRPYGGLFRNILRQLDHIFVQDANSSELLKSIGLDRVTVAGDTRVDRVASITREAEKNKIVEQFGNGLDLFIVGSSWPQDIEILSDLINNERHLKFIIAPHEVNDHQINHLEKVITRPKIRYTDYNGENNRDVLIVNTIGILSHLYQYGKYAYIGGGFGKGLHNTLEAATFGLPLFFGNSNYRKFAEAVALENSGGAFPVGNYRELYQNYITLEKDKDQYYKASNACRNYVEQHKGATNIIMKYLEGILKET